MSRCPNLPACMLGLMLAVAGSTPFAAEQTAGPAVDPALAKRFDKVLERKASIHGFRCSFVQTIEYAAGDRARFSGEVAVRRPGLFRWHYDKPYEQLYVGDGDAVWHYEPDLMQAERMQGLDAVDPVVLKLLDGRIRPDAVRLLEAGETEEGFTRFSIEIEGVDLALAVDEDNEIRWIERRDALGNRNRIALAGCRWVAPPLDVFSFQPPPGVDVVDAGG